MTLESISQFLAWVIIYPPLFFIIFTALFRISIKFSRDAHGQYLTPGDPAASPMIWSFFSFAWEQLRPLGFEPVAYTRIERLQGRTALVVALFRNVTAGDSAAAICNMSLGPNPALMSVEFTATCANGVMVDTGNAPTPIVFHHGPEQSVWRLPNLGSLPLLYAVHRRHLEWIGSPGVLSPAKPREAIDDFIRGCMIMFEHQVRHGILVPCDRGRKFAFTWRSAFRAGWQNLPPMKQLIEARLAREGRALLSRLGLGDRYETVNYKKMFRNAPHAMTLPTLPPDEAPPPPAVAVPLSVGWSWPAEPGVPIAHPVGDDFPPTNA